MASSSEDKYGFTLIEIVVAVFVATILSMAVTVFSRGIFKNSSILQSSLTNQTDIRKTFKAFTSEVRSISPGWDGSYPVAIASSTTFVFYTNIDDDKYTEKIRYFLSGTSLKKGIIEFNIASGRYDTVEIEQFVIKDLNVASGTRIFTYFDKDYDGTESYSSIPDPIDISKVRLVRFDINNNHFGKSINSGIKHTVQVSLRNLKDNY